MSLHTIMDQQFKRVLDYLGLRGLVPHEYESTVLPVVVVGEMQQPSLIAEAINIAGGTAIFTVPAGESWEILAIGGLASQAAGTVAYRFGLHWYDSNSARSFQVPIFAESDSVGEVMSCTLTLNGTRRWLQRPSPKFIVGQGFQLAALNIAGDGTRQNNFVWLMYRRHGERLTDLS